MVLKESFFGAARRRTFICCRNVQISASRAARDRIRSATVQPISLQRSLIPQQDCLILDQLPAGYVSDRDNGRRRILWFGVTAHPTAEWIANQITQACGWEQAPCYLIRDRDRAYGDAFVRRLRSMGIRDRPTSPRSPWQNGYAERLIGSIRRECVDHIIILGERHLRHVLLSYMKYYNEIRTHLCLEKDAPVPRAIGTVGDILCRPVMGGLHHQYVRI